MGLTSGARLGAYEILSLLGSGGTGEVYRARDVKLGRDVALKVLPTELTLDGDRLARFTREAQVLASLNHPNIAAIYGLEESDGVRALVLELVEGPTLADRVARGAMPFDEALPIAKQIAEAIEEAHEQGIIHRDLKPANVKMRPNGTVKVLDFGLAKLATDGSHGSGRPGGVTQSPTLTSPIATVAGMILGTAAYMAPEQARGKPVDKRTDIWAFGCVLFEMLAGKQVFGGESVTDALASIVKEHPRWQDLPSDIPESVRALIGRCLEKDPRQRLQAIGEARIALEAAVSQPRLTESVARNRLVNSRMFDDGHARRVFEQSVVGRYMPPGYLLFGLGGRLLAQPFDVSRLQLSGAPVLIADGLGRTLDPGSPIWSVSEAGHIAYRTSSGVGQRQLTWLDRSGTEVGKVGEPDAARAMRTH